jgi:acyl-ACP thioesterase
MENNGIWSESFKIAAYMTDKKCQATLTTIAHLFQEVSWAHAKARDLGYEGMKERGMFWVLNRLKINILRLPVWQEEVIVETWITEIVPFSHRHYRIANSQNETYITGASLWLPLDMQSRRPRRITDFDVVFRPDLAQEMPKKLPPTEGGILSNQQTVSYSDMDMQGHFTNAQYIKWIYDDVYKNEEDKTIKSLEINYLNEVFKNEKIDIMVKKSGNVIAYSLKKSDMGVEVCRADVEV